MTPAVAARALIQNKRIVHQVLDQGWPLVCSWCGQRFADADTYFASQNLCASRQYVLSGPAINDVWCYSVYGLPTPTDMESK